jgi:hypothetical protein
MADVDGVVNPDGSLLIPAEALAAYGLKPGEHVAVSLAPQPGKSSRGILKGKFPSLSDADLREARAVMIEDFEARRVP